MDDDVYKSWRQVLSCHLGKKILRHCDGLIADIVAVDHGLKPAYLYDIGCPSADVVVALLQNLHADKLIQNFVNVLEMGDDILIVNVSEIHSLSECVNLKLMLVDVSEHNKKPVVYSGENAIKEISSDITYIVDKLDSSQICKVNVDVKCNMSSLFGFLLAYPIIYWFSDEDGNQNNCLAMEQLSCVKLTVKWKLHYERKEASSKSHVLYSFSFPSELKENYKHVLDAWCERHINHIQTEGFFSEVSVKTEVTALEAVCL